jgi:hypothetical protein
VDAGEGAFVRFGVCYDVHVEGDTEVGYVAFLIGSDYQYEFRADHFQCVGYSCEDEFSADVGE